MYREKEVHSICICLAMCIYIYIEREREIHITHFNVSEVGAKRTLSEDHVEYRY